MSDVPPLLVPHHWNMLSAMSGRAEFERQLPVVAWFSRVGKPFGEEFKVVPLGQWWEWPGPEDPAVMHLAAHLQSIRDAIELLADDHGVQLEAVWKRLHDTAFRFAQAGSPLFDQAEDAWHPPTQCVWDAAFVAALMGCHLELAVDPHPDVLELWGWFEAGRWPCGFATDQGQTRWLLIY